MPPNFEYSFDFCGQQLVAAADRTLWWPAEGCLFLADLHAGKAEHLRRAGLALPTGNLAADLARLSAAAARTGAARVIVLGDLFHSDPNREWDELSAWCQRQPFSFELVRGNHDRFMSDAVFTAGGLVVHPEPYQLAPFELRHHPLGNPDRPVLCGHLHPVREAHGPARDRFRLPGFWLQDNQIVLPAFGSLTGGYEVPRQAGGGFLACSPDFTALVSLL